MRKVYVIGALACLFVACKPNVRISKTLTTGQADFTNYLAIGNSITAGYADGSLTNSGQLNSYPQRLFEQFKLVSQNNGGFVHPLLPGNNGYPWPKKILVLRYGTCTADTVLAPVDYPGALDSFGSSRFVGTLNNGQINNIAVPGIRAVDYLVGNYALLTAAAGNPYASRFYNNTSGTPLEELTFRVNTLHPTFFSLWLGANDVLGYALAGGQGDGSGAALPAAAPFYYNPNDISPYNQFDTCYDRIVDKSISTGARGVLINVPDITALPYFTTIPIDGLEITRQEYADSLQKLWGSVTHKVFQTGPNNYIVTDHNGLVRQSVPGELLLMPVIDSIKCKGWGVTTPIPKEWVLTTEEIQNIRNAVTSYNSFIKFLADRHVLAYVDMNKFFNTMATGYSYNGIKYSTEYISGGAFSLDGVHPTPRGQAIIANEIITVINDFYKSNMPMLDVNAYHGIDFP